MARIYANIIQHLLEVAKTQQIVTQHLRDLIVDLQEALDKLVDNQRMYDDLSAQLRRLERLIRRRDSNDV